MTLKQAIIEETGILTPEIFVREGMTNSGRFVVLNQARLAELDRKLADRQENPDTELIQEINELRHAMRELERYNRQLQTQLTIAFTGGSIH